MIMVKLNRRMSWAAGEALANSQIIERQRFTAELAAKPSPQRDEGCFLISPFVHVYNVFPYSRIISLSYYPILFSSSVQPPLPLMLIHTHISALCSVLRDRDCVRLATWFLWACSRVLVLKIVIFSHLNVCVIIYKQLLICTLIWSSLCRYWTGSAEKFF